jgi:hypothetical protein
MFLAPDRNDISFSNTLKGGTIEITENGRRAL